MAASFDGATQKATWANPYNAINAPITMACWVKPTVLAPIDKHFLHIQRAAGGDGIWLGTRLSNDRFAPQRAFASTAKSRWTPFVHVVAGRWQHFAFTDYGLGTAASDIDLYGNGSALYIENPQNGFGSAVALDGLLVLAGRTADEARNYTGLLAEAAVWNRVLTGPELVRLGAGQSAVAAAPSGLVFYAPLTTAAGWSDQVSAAPATVIGGATLVADHPPIATPPALWDGLTRSVRYPAAPVYHAAVASATTAHSKGVWTEIVPSLPFAADWLVLEVMVPPVPYYVVPNTFLFDVGVGALGNESVVLADLFQGAMTGTSHPAFQVPVPLSIPAGARVAIRVQANPAPALISLGVHFGQGTMAAGAGAVPTYGAVPATTLSTTVDPGATVNTKGAWATVTTNSQALRGLLVRMTAVGAVHFGGFGGDHQRLTDIGISVDGVAWEVVVPDIYHAVGSNGGVPYTDAASWWFPVTIPAGLRIGARGQSSSTHTTARQWGVQLIGVG